MFELNTGIKIISMAQRLQVTESLSTCIARKATHARTRTDPFSFCGFAKWFFINSID